MRIAFHSNQLGYRGTEVYLKNLATFNQTILNNESFIVAPPDTGRQGEGCFKDFNVQTISPEDYEKYCKDMRVDYFYSIKPGHLDFCKVPYVKQLNHFVFANNWDFHGHRCAFISEYLVKKAKSQSRTRWDHEMLVDEWCVPFYVEKLDYTNEDFRSLYNISKDQIVLGYHGGNDSFDISWVKQTLIEIIEKNKNIVFIFLGIDPFALPDNSFYKNFIFIAPNIDLEFKNKFINTCDGMIHARRDGETFGLSIGEFSLKNKPVLTFTKFNSEIRPVENLDSDYDTAHIEYLKETGWYYRNPAELKYLVQNFEDIRESRKDTDYSLNYSKYNDPEYIMNRFSRVFLTP